MYQLRASDAGHDNALIFEAETRQEIRDYVIENFGLSEEDADALIRDSQLAMADAPEAYNFLIEESIVPETQLHKKLTEVLDDLTEENGGAQEEEPEGDISRAGRFAGFVIQYANELHQKLQRSDVRGARTSIQEIEGALQTVKNHIDEIATQQDLPTLGAGGKNK